MRLALPSCGLLALGLLGCQPADYVDPVDDTTGHPPRAAGVIYEFDAARSSTFLDASLRQSNSIAAAWHNDGEAIRPLPVNGAYPATAGVDANLRAGAGFGTYPNPDYRGDGVTWDDADPFRSVLRAEVNLGDEGNGITFCRSFATTCLTLLADPLGLGANVAVVTLAANVPDTDIGEISAGVSAAIRGTGANGLSIALADQNVVGMPFLASGDLEVEWSLERGALPGSLAWSVSVNGVELGAGNTAVDLAAAIVKTRGVALVFDTPLGANTSTWFNTSYSFNHQTSAYFEDPLGVGVDLSPLPGLGHAPLHVYTTTDSEWAFGTNSGNAGSAHAVQHADGIVGAITQPAAAGGQHIVWSAAFDGDDFEDTFLEGMVDMGGTGGGFYPPPTFCHAQVVPQVHAAVSAGVRQRVHLEMYRAVAMGVKRLDAPEMVEEDHPGVLVAITAGLNLNFETTLTYTQIFDDGDESGYQTLASDYADNNVDANISTSVESSYTVTLTESVSTTFVSQFAAIFSALNVQVEGTPRWQLLGIEAGDFQAMGALLVGLTAPPGVKDGVMSGTTPVLDDYPSPCNGYDCNVRAVFSDVAAGTNFTGSNPAPSIPALAAACQWGVAPAEAVAATSATPIDLAQPATIFPAYPEQPATPAVAPVREQAAPAMNDLVMGIYGNFITQAFGPTVPASNFSLSMATDAEAEVPPSLTRLSVAVE